MRHRTCKTYRSYSAASPRRVICTLLGSALIEVKDDKARIAWKNNDLHGRFTPLGGRSWNAPIITDGKLIVRNQKELACFDLK